MSYISIDAASSAGKVMGEQHRIEVKDIATAVGLYAEGFVPSSTRQHRTGTVWVYTDSPFIRETLHCINTGVLKPLSAREYRRALKRFNAKLAKLQQLQHRIPQAA